MKANPSKEFYSNKSGMQDKKSSNMVIKTNLQNSFDSRWAEIKIQGKNIGSRSNHVSIIFGNSMLVHGGYDVEKGVLGDFYSMDLSEDCQQFVWKEHNNLCDGKQIKLKNHSGVSYKENFIVFGGQIVTGISSSKVYIHDFVTKKWRIAESNIEVPKVDSHCAVVIDAKMYVYGGYISDKADYMTDIYALDLTSFTWEIAFKGGKSKEPAGRSNFAMVEEKGNLLIFGGTDGNHTLKDMWVFDVKSKQWKQIETKDTPDERRGHSLLQFDNCLFMFGGIQDITKEKNDICIFKADTAQWNKIHTTTNSIYDCSPTLKKGNKKNNNLESSFSPTKISPEKSDRGDIAMKKILNENRHKKFMERKKQLLKQFAEEDQDKPKRKRQLSPTTESMAKTLEAIGNQQNTHKQLQQEIIYDDSHRFIIGKKPCARDGQSVSLFNGKMYIFGGDRHLMAFNDLYQFDLALGIKSLELYRNP